MSYELTENKEYRKPVRGSGEQFDSDVYSETLDEIDGDIAALEEAVTALQGEGTGPVLGLVSSYTALTELDPQPDRGSLYSVQAGGHTGLQHDILLQRISGAWSLISPVVQFDTKANLDTFVTAVSTAFRRGQRFWSNADSGREYLWNGSTIEPTRIVQSDDEPTNPVTGQLWVDTNA